MYVCGCSALDQSPLAFNNRDVFEREVPGTPEVLTLPWVEGKACFGVPPANYTYCMPVFKFDFSFYFYVVLYCYLDVFIFSVNRV